MKQELRWGILFLLIYIAVVIFTGLTVQETGVLLLFNLYIFGIPLFIAYFAIVIAYYYASRNVFFLVIALLVAGIAGEIYYVREIM